MSTVAIECREEPIHNRIAKCQFRCELPGNTATGSGKNVTRVARRTRGAS
jgi:hypothetical protein